MVADAKTIPLADESVQCVVTSPPYWGLRDYGTARWEGGDADCNHKQEPPRFNGPKQTTAQVSGHASKAEAHGRRICQKCGAVSTDRQLGLEKTPEEYVAKMVEVFREVKRVLRKDGTLWLNLGDSYAVSGCGGGSFQPERLAWEQSKGKRIARGGGRYGGGNNHVAGLKPKDLVGIPWRVAFALQADGWWLRQDIIWSKPNPMPESVTDRCTKAHEMVFLLTKSPRYFYDALAIQEGVGEPRVIERANSDRQSLVFGQDIWPKNPRSTLAAIGVCLAAAVLDLAQRQYQVGLLPLNAEMGQKRPNDPTGSEVISTPIMRRATSQASRFTNGDVSAKEFLEEMDRLCITLPDGDDLKEAWRSSFGTARPVPPVHANSDGAVRVNNASEVGQVQVSHSQQSTTGVPARQGRNRRSVWHIPTQPYNGAHFATFPEKLVEPCILAGTSERGACSQCGAPWERVVERKAMVIDRSERTHELGRTPSSGTMLEPAESLTLGWKPTCSCAAPTKPCLVLDPFCGSGTVGVVCARSGRDFVGLDISEAYLELARQRIGDIPNALPFHAEVTA